MKREDINKVLIIGSGLIVIGQACELNKAGVLDNDFSGVSLTLFGSGYPRFRALALHCSTTPTQRSCFGESLKMLSHFFNAPYVPQRLTPPLLSLTLFFLK
ncbi:hypothetical protein, partial [uncultured Treponema sp.]|uniref:hypothetical protein n=1 Tax=uncultured Treponema sp. TaxID=162155 RepID=UPI0025DDE775